MLIYTNIFISLYEYIYRYIERYIKAEAGLLAPAAETPGKTRSLEQIWGHSTCNTPSGTGLIPMDAQGDAGESRVHPRPWEQRDPGKPTPLSSAPALPWGSGCDLKPCSAVKAAKPS